MIINMDKTLETPPYAIAAPMQIGATPATTVALGLANIVFDSPQPFTPGEQIEFSVRIVRSGIRLDCRGGVTSCLPMAGGRYRSAATIDTFQVG
jgi:hypothetical protein